MGKPDIRSSAWQLVSHTLPVVAYTALDTIHLTVNDSGASFDREAAKLAEVVALIGNLQFLMIV